MRHPVATERDALHAHRSFYAGEATEDHGRIHVAQMADAKAAALERPEGARKRHLEAFARERAQGIDIDPLAYFDSGDRHRARGGDPAMQEQRAFARPALHCRLHRAREQRVAGEYRVEPFALKQRERRLDPVQQVLRRRAAELLVTVGRLDRKSVV